MRVAIVHDDFMQWGGAERLVAALAQLFPKAPVYTSMLDDQVVAKSGLDRSRFVTTFMDRLPFKSALNKPLFSVYPVVLEAIDFSNFDLVISSSTRFAHGVITKPDTKHIAYINSPFRGFWEPDLYFGTSTWGKIQARLLAPMLSYLRGWDYVAGQRPDLILANSKTAQGRVNKYYRRESTVLYPFVDLERFDQQRKPDFSRFGFELENEYYVVISRLVEWKKLDIAVQTFNRLGKQLLVIGHGPFRDQLVQMAGPSVQVVGFISDQELSYVLRRARGLIHPQKEDFGMTVVEANYCGVGVIAYQDGGALDTVIEHQTGVFFGQQSVESLAEAVRRFEQLKFESDFLKQHALKFSRDRFVDEWQQYVSQYT